MDIGMNLKTFLLTTLVVVSPQLVNAEETEKSSIKTLQSQIIKKEQIQRRVDWELAPVKSRADLETILERKSPLDALSESAKQEFTDSIVFRENGIGGMNYGVLEAELTPTQIYKILSLFGSQSLMYVFKNARVETTTDALLISNDDNPIINMLPEHIDF
ncbi:hypothetical protein [Gallaecimonas mangrovi]|uniref:hypothetical protein n=1 Tax=Gallaecimonas mangrovi TaxID=2291597 RepID=UPI000E20350B|nr:hypothetical protein [Gallaecimonas mangrovi]